jgi:hypothetical protein
MNIQGKLHRITDPFAFINSWTATNGKPTAGFTAWPKARIHLGTDFPTGQFVGQITPSMSMETDTDASGFFKFVAPELSATKFRGQIVAYNVSSMAAPNLGIALPPIPVFELVYRSQAFTFAEVSPAEQAQVRDIFVFQAETPNNMGLSQAHLSDQVASLRQQLKLDALKATITSNRISVSAQKLGGDVKFDAWVTGSIGSDLAQVIEVRVGEIDIDLPGPDFIVGLCVSKSDIEKQIRTGMASAVAQMNKPLLAAKDAMFKTLSKEVTMSVWRTRHAQTGSTTVKLPGGAPELHIPVLSIVPDPAFGVPLRLY